MRPPVGVGFVCDFEELARILSLYLVALLCCLLSLINIYKLAQNLGYSACFKDSFQQPWTALHLQEIIKVRMLFVMFFRQLDLFTLSLKYVA